MKPFNLLLFLFFAATSLLLLGGCSTLPITGPLPDNLTAEKVASIDEQSPLAISPDSKVVALNSSGLKLFHLPTGQQVDVSARNAHRAAWSPLGYSLAASFTTGGTSTLVTYDQYGIKVAEAEVEGEITDLAWLSEHELLAASVTITTYKFGNNFKTLLHRWLPGRNTPTSTPLRDSTLQSVTVRTWLPLLRRGPMLDISRTADQILYMHPLDPPVFKPYYKLILRDLTNGKEMEIASLGMTSSGGRFTADSELIFYGDGAGKTTVYNPWTDEAVRRFNAAGRTLEISPAGDYSFVDGALYHGDTRVAMLAPEGVGRFTPDGRQLLVAARNDLYLLKGLQPANDRLLPVAQLEKLLQPRVWRLDNLISAKEYKETLERIKRQ